jgi:hypothetical protein
VIDTPVLQRVLRADANRTLHMRDSRPVDFRLSKRITEHGPIISPYSVFARVHVKDGLTYEGRIQEWAKQEAGLPVLLSPACRIEKDGRSERVGRIYGPGVLLTITDEVVVELYEQQASPCWRCFLATKTRSMQAMAAMTPFSRNRQRRLHDSACAHARTEHNDADSRRYLKREDRLRLAA